jgi:hypothetical protein
MDDSWLSKLKRFFSNDSKGLRLLVGIISALGVPLSLYGALAQDSFLSILNGALCLSIAVDSFRAWRNFPDEEEDE